MPVETPSLFAQIIQDHLELKKRNSKLESELPIDRYQAEDPFENHPLFKTEEQARIEETMDGEVNAHSILDTGWTIEEPAEEAPSEEDGLWSKSRDFDWGD